MLLASGREARDATEHLTKHRTAPPPPPTTPKDGPALNVSSVMVEKPYFGRNCHNAIQTS